ncbi:unnamed protein product [Lasius platythorax]|uniref:Uncharacterized protein n=1 Tax=Lasius platythorax TaxID=488582 RepID=A0AAV2NVC9_9HYME
MLAGDLDTRLKGVLTRSSRQTAHPSGKHLRSVPRLLGGPYTTICSCMKIARYDENCSVPSLEHLLALLGIYELTTCALRCERGSRAAEPRPLRPQ